MLQWQKKLASRGWLCPNWPKEYGGRGASVLEQLIWHEEYALAGGPPSGCMFVSLSHAGPTLIVSGNEEQKARYLQPLLDGDIVSCFSMTEPQAGADLAPMQRGVVGDMTASRKNKVPLVSDEEFTAELQRRIGTWLGKVEVVVVEVSISLDIMLASPRETKLPIDFILMGSKNFLGNPP